MRTKVGHKNSKRKKDVAGVEDKKRIGGQSRDHVGHYHALRYQTRREKESFSLLTTISGVFFYYADVWA